MEGFVEPGFEAVGDFAGGEHFVAEDDDEVRGLDVISEAVGDDDGGVDREPGGQNDDNPEEDFFEVFFNHQCFF